MASTILQTWTVRSSRGRQTYDVHLAADGRAWCSCPGWRYQSKPSAERSCKHVRGLAAAIAAVLARPAPAAPLLVAPPISQARPAPGTYRDRRADIGEEERDDADHL